MNSHWLGQPSPNIRFGGGVADTIVNPAVLAIVVLAGLLVLLLPRKRAYLPFAVIGILTPINQIVVLGGMHFPMLRVLALFGFVRITWGKIFKREKVFSGGMNGIDWAVIVLTIFTLIDGVLLWQESSQLIFQIGSLMNIFGCYLLARHLIRDADDIMRVLKAMTWVVVLVAAIMTYEHTTGVNLYYSLLGGANAQELSKALDRADIFRARGCFAHPIIAGTFGGFMVPLFVAWWKREKQARKHAAIGVIGAATIPFLTGSSTALFALIAGIGALCLWPMRRRLWILRWGAIGTLIAGQLYMTSPVWHLIEDVSLSKDSSSDHRYELVNQCIIHFWNWVLIGTKDYPNWGWEMWDLSNQYVGTAETAGLIPLIAFVAILVVGFLYIGKARRYHEGNKPEESFIWAIGASLFANAVGFFGIGYWDQVIVAWYMVLAIIAAATLPTRRSPEKVPPAVGMITPQLANIGKPAAVTYVTSATPRLSGFKTASHTYYGVSVPGR